MATKSEENLRAFVEEEDPPPAPTPAGASPAPSSPLPGVIPPAPATPKNAPQSKKRGASSKTSQMPAAPKKTAGGPVVTPAGQQTGRAAEQATGQLQDNLTSWGNRLVDRIGGWDTPGGVGLVLLALFILLWMIVPVNGGHTRFGLLWLTLTGQTYLPDDSIPSAPSQTGVGGCPPGYLPDGKGGCQKAIITPFVAVQTGPTQPYQGSGWPDFSGANGFNPGNWIGV